MLSSSTIQKAPEKSTDFRALESALKIPDKKVSKEIKPLTALRIFPALAVILNHASEYFSCWHGLSNYYIAGQALTFFFVLSGFLLTLNYFHLADMKGAFKFYLARVARIWPAHVISLTLLLAAMPEIFKITGAKLPVFLSNLFMTQSWIPSWQVYFSYNAPSWSNATEFFFYLCFPFLFWGMKKKWYLPMAITAPIVLAIIYYCNVTHMPEFDATKLSTLGVLYIHPITRLFDFTVGMTLGLLWKNHSSKINLATPVFTTLEVLLLVGVCVLNACSSALRYACVPWAGEGGAFWLQNSGPSLIGFGALIFVFALQRGYMSKVLSNPFLVLMGELGFGAYMLHGVFITYLGVNFPQAQSLNSCLLFLTTLFIAAHLMSELLEKPIRTLMISNGGNLINKLAGSTSPEKSSVQNEAQRSRGGKDSSNRSSINSSNQDNSRKTFARRLRLSCELVLLFLLVYFGFPTIQRINDTQAGVLATGAAVKDVNFAPFIKCDSASATIAKDKVNTKIVWQALKAQSINYSITETAKDVSGAVLASLTYTLDGRTQHVKQGTKFLDQMDIQLSKPEQVSTIEVCLRKNKRGLMQNSDGKIFAKDCSFVIPVQK